MLELDHIRQGLVAMRAAGLNDYGRWPATSEDLNAIAEVWLARMNANRVSPQEFAERVAWLIDNETEFPSVASFLKGLDRSYWQIQDPVIVGISDLGVQTLAERSKVDPARILDDPKLTALPVTDEQRKQALERIENLTVTKVAKAKRMKASELIAQDKKIQALPEPTEADRQRLQKQIEEARERQV